MQLALVLFLVFAVAIALFAVQNTTPVTLNFLAFSIEQVALSLLVLIAATLGAALTFAFGLVREVQHRRAMHALREQARAHEHQSLDLAKQLQRQALPQPPITRAAASDPELAGQGPNPATERIGQAPPPES
ncbi:MAG: LapA family protein [Chloroflexi bacterium]|nr:LapA family protein [Chloroflexota bacterium]